jgi:hypothetical protein
MPVPERRSPPGSVAVDVALAVGIDQARAHRFNDDDGVDFRSISTHLCVWMPHTTLVALNDSPRIFAFQGG